MRILVTNDDGVFAPGIAALARGLTEGFAATPEHSLVVVAPLVDCSGSGAAVGRVYDRESIPYEKVVLPGLEQVPTYGIDGQPALAIILACIGGFGDRPDLIVSGINHGINAGRSALHSGTIGATLTGAQFKVRGLAVSIAWSEGPVPWETPVTLVNNILPALVTADPATVLNLNVPAVPLDQLLGIRKGQLGTAGLIRSVRAGEPNHNTLGNKGAITLSLRGSRDSDRAAERAEVDPKSDAGTVEAGWASLTALTGVREDVAPSSIEVVERALTSCTDHIDR